MESYPVQFKSTTFQGLARFVPAGENPETYIKQEIYVEIAHESIVGLRISENKQHQVMPLAKKFSYQVRGEVDAINYHSEPIGNRTTYIVSGDVVFALSLADIGDLRPNKGEAVEFEVYGLSFWDESI